MEKTFFNCDCVKGAKKYLKANSVDLIICDPPYGIKGDTLDKHYNRKKDFVLDNYIEVPAKEYAQFSVKWIKEAERVLKPGGSIYIISGYTHLAEILNALKKTSLKEINHIIWKYNFGVYTKKKFISSHYHILFYTKPGKPHKFNTFCRYSDTEKSKQGKSLNYKDREDVWLINREYKKGEVKNINELPKDLLKKMILYSSDEGDLVCDFFLGGFSTAKVAMQLNRKAFGFEANKTSYDHHIKEMDSIKIGSLLSKPKKVTYFKQGKPLSSTEKNQIIKEFKKLKQKGLTKKDSLEKLSKKFGRGPWSLSKILKS